MAEPIPVVFMGSPAVALPSLRALLEHPAVRVVGVVTQPDRPVGRRRSLQPCPVKAAAEDAGLPVLAPPRIRDGEAVAALRAWGAHLAVVCAYGQILSETVLQIPPLGCYNLHFSLLPRWRGASPVQAALLAGDSETGVSLQRMVLELDAGDIAAETGALPIRADDTAGSLSERLAERAGTLLADALPRLLTGQPPLTPQNPAGITRCGLIRKTDGIIDFAAESAVQIERKCRAYTPWPGCHAYLGARRLGLVRMNLVDAQPVSAANAAPGILSADGLVGTKQGTIRLEEVRPEGKTAMPFQAFRNGNPDAIGARLTPKPA